MDNNETFVVYFGFADCPWCRSVLPTLLDVADDLKIDKIYYVDVKEIRNKLDVDDEGNVRAVASSTFFKVEVGEHRVDSKKNSNRGELLPGDPAEL